MGTGGVLLNVTGAEVVKNWEAFSTEVLHFILGLGGFFFYVVIPTFALNCIWHSTA